MTKQLTAARRKSTRPLPVWVSAEQAIGFGLKDAQSKHSLDKRMDNDRAFFDAYPDWQHTFHNTENRDHHGRTIVYEASGHLKRSGVMYRRYHSNTQRSGTLQDAEYRFDGYPQYDLAICRSASGHMLFSVVSLSAKGPFPGYETISSNDIGEKGLLAQIDSLILAEQTKETK